MDFQFTSEQEALREVCRQFAVKEVEPVWKDADDNAEFPIELLQKAAEKGLIGIAISSENEGQGLGASEEVIFIEEVSKVNPNIAAAFIVISALPPSLLEKFGTRFQKENYLFPIMHGKKIIALGVTEPNASNDIQGIKTTAVKDGSEWVLNGEKCFISLANYADEVLVLAQTDQGRNGMKFFIVKTDAPGLKIDKMDMWVNRPAPTTQISLTEVRVPEEDMLDAGFREIMETFNKERILVSARWLGHMQHAFEWSLKYSKEREQFGRPIGQFQSIAFQLAECKTDIEAARYLTYHAAWLWDQGLPIKQIIPHISVSKLFVTEAVHRVTQKCVHIGGGWGLTKELPIMRMALDAMIAPVTVGSVEVQKRVIARQLGLKVD